MSAEYLQVDGTPEVTTVEILENETLIIGGEVTYAKNQISETMANRQLLARMVIVGSDWKLQGDCGKYDIETAIHIFFGPKGSERKQLRLEREKLAKSICARCVVIDTCLSYALNNREKGIWGGMTEEEREGSRSVKQ